jgi:hypothetical protein
MPFTPICSRCRNQRRYATKPEGGLAFPPTLVHLNGEETCPPRVRAQKPARPRVSTAAALSQVLAQPDIAQ